MSLAEELAERRNLPVVLLVPVEAGRVMEGHPLIARTADGAEVLVRLMTADEFITAQHAAAAEYGAELVSREMAERVTRPVVTS